MTSSQFCYMLQFTFEMFPAQEISKKQIGMIQTYLDIVFEQWPSDDSPQMNFCKQLASVLEFFDEGGIHDLKKIKEKLNVVIAHIDLRENSSYKEKLKEIHNLTSYAHSNYRSQQ